MTSGQKFPKLFFGPKTLIGQPCNGTHCTVTRRQGKRVAGKRASGDRGRWLMLVRLHNDTAIQDNLLHFTSAHSTTAEYKAGYIMTRCHRTALTATGNGLHYSCLYTATQLQNTGSCILKVSILTITTPLRYLFYGSTRYYTIFWDLIRLSHDISDISWLLIGAKFVKK